MTEIIQNMLETSGFAGMTGKHFIMIILRLSFYI